LGEKLGGGADDKKLKRQPDGQGGNGTFLRSKRHQKKGFVDKTVAEKRMLALGKKGLPWGGREIRRKQQINPKEKGALKEGHSGERGGTPAIFSKAK